MGREEQKGKKPTLHAYSPHKLGKRKWKYQTHNDLMP
uniref:Uncharacterized protein n=1 Tax=Rhizophora mucronata TaxID=61149 RepID=A0A2P2NA79_RHIMU